MRLSQQGRIVWEHWIALPQHYPNAQLDAFVAMPNHVHGIILLNHRRLADVGTGFKPAPTHGLPEIVRAFKTFSSRAINAVRGTPGQPVWQRSYYDRIIRDEEEMARIQQYILDNPRKWANDRENLGHT
jgi:putative transposase